MTSEEKKADKEWWKNEILTPLEETFNISSSSYKLITQAFQFLESANLDDLSKIDECLFQIKKDNEQSEKKLDELRDKLNKKYPKREYDPREKKARRSNL